MKTQSDLKPLHNQVSKSPDKQLKELCNGVGRMLNPQRKERDLGDILSPK